MTLKKANSVYNEIVLDAEWWIPSNPDNKFQGTLTGSVAYGFVLKLYGAFLEDHEDVELIDVIMGQSRSGDEYTLLNNLYLGAKRRISHPDSPDLKNNIKSEYRANWTITGEHFNVNYSSDSSSLINAISSSRRISKSK